MKNYADMQRIGELTAQCLDDLEYFIAPGITTQDIETFVHSYQIRNNLQNSQKGYHGFPGYACVGRNNVVCHGVPSAEEILEEGDIVSVDVTFNLNGWHGDTCRTYPVGKINDRKKNLIKVAKKALEIGINAAKKNLKINDVGKEIQQFVESNGYHVARAYGGHGIGRSMHLMPFIPHWDANHTGSFQPGKCYTIEPIILEKETDCVLDKDKWTVKTIGDVLAAQFEHTIFINNAGKIKILTQ